MWFCVETDFGLSSDLYNPGLNYRSTNVQYKDWTQSQLKNIVLNYYIVSNFEHLFVVFIGLGLETPWQRALLKGNIA